MANNPMYAMTIFGKDDADLHQWYQSIDPRVSRSKIGREAFLCYRLFDGSLAQAQEAQAALAEMRRLFGNDWRAGVAAFEKAVEGV